MASHAIAHRSRRGLLALVIVSLLLLFVATIVGGRHGGVQCAPFPSGPVAASPTEGQIPPLAQVTPEQPHAPSEHADEAPAAPTSGGGALVRGFVVDVRAGQAVPFVTVEVRADKDREIVQADSSGTFATTRTFPSAELRIEVFDGEASYGVTKLDRDPRKAARIAIEIGPTFLVNAIGMRSVQASDAWMLRLVQTPRPLYSSGEIAVRDQELSIAIGPDMVWTEVPLRFADREAFARWPKVEFDRIPEYRTRVEVRSAPRCERGATEVSEPVGLQTLPDVLTRRVLVLSGIVGAAGRVGPGPVRVLIRPSADSAEKLNARVPDFREVQITRETFEVEVGADQLYSVLAWCSGGEPTLLERELEESGRYQLRDGLIGVLRYPSFDPAVVPPEFRRNTRRGSQIVRARVHGAGAYALPIVDLWEAFRNIRPGDLLETRYDMESIGIDCSPATLGLSWTQILPGEIVPDRLPSDVVARPHRIEWVDRVFETVRTDALLTGGPGGSIVTMQETSLKATWTVIPKTPLRFTVWKDGFEPVPVRSEDFVERGEENVASVALHAGWGVSIAFVVIDAEQNAPGVSGWTTKSRERGARKTFSTNLDFLGLPPLPGVGVTSPQAGARSDADGCVLLHATTWPDRLTLHAPGYRLHELRRLSGGGARWIAYMEHDRYDR